MKKANTIFICSKCGNEFSRWSGKCSMCGEWNSLQELKVESGRLKGTDSIEKAEPVSLRNIKKLDLNRVKTGIEEFDLSLGGGLVPGAVVLLGGQPGVGKSTLVWQVACMMKGKVVYIAGEESPTQIRIRAERIGKNFDDIIIFENQDISSWADQLAQINPSLLIVDSIQTIYDSQAAGSPGSLLQVKHCALKILSIAKKISLASIIIGHVTKEGEVAGPKTLEHLVDAIFYLEGEKGISERFLRSQKNRFGPTEEMGVLRLTENGFVSAADFGRLSPENLLPTGLSRTSVAEGSRIYIIEVQALVQKSPFGFPKRTAVGFDLNRLLMMIAILNRHTKINLSEHDVFVNISDGYKLKDPIGDLAVLSALASSYYNMPVSGDKMLLGEVDLAGRVHLPEVAKRIILAAKKMGYKPISNYNLELDQIIGKVLDLKSGKDALRS